MLLQTIARVKQAFIDQRRSQRYPTNCRAWIEFDDHTPPLNCTLVDISDGGARIQVAAPHRLPEEFSLILTEDAGHVRRCRIIWRADDEIGISYLEPYTP
jgi:PilZ domain-containing protein